MKSSAELFITPKGKKLLKEIWITKFDDTYVESDKATARFGLLSLQAEAQGDEPDYGRTLNDLSDEINAGGEERPSNKVISQVAQGLVKSGHLEIGSGSYNR